MGSADDVDPQGEGAGADTSRAMLELERVLELHGLPFLESAYRLLLQREPDEGGLSLYLPRVLDGTPKVQILADMASSREARELAVNLSELTRAVALNRLARLPLLGAILSGISGVEGNSAFDARLRAVEELLHADTDKAESMQEAPTGQPPVDELPELTDADAHREQLPQLAGGADRTDDSPVKREFEGRPAGEQADSESQDSRNVELIRPGLDPSIPVAPARESQAHRSFSAARCWELERDEGNDVTGCEIHCLKVPDVRGEAAVFVTHSSDGLIRPHVIHYLAALKRQGICVVLTIAADRPMQAVTPETMSLICGLFVRENKGYDFAAWAHILRLYPVLFSAPVLYLLNDSLFGPFSDTKFARLIGRIRDSAADMIGLTDSKEYQWHVQSYFLAFRPRVLSSVAFSRFINGIECLGDKDAMIQAYELKLAAHLRDQGFKVEVIFDSPEVVADAYRDNKTLFKWRELIDIGFPFVKVAVLSGVHADVDRSGWRPILDREGYDASLVDATLAIVADTDKVGRAGPDADVRDVGALVIESRPSRSLPLRVAFIGPWNYDSALGFASRGYVSALWHTGFLVNVHPIREPFDAVKRLVPTVDCCSFSGNPHLVIVHLNPDNWYGLLSAQHRVVVSGACKVVGAWAWDAGQIPANWHPGFDAVDAIWTPSRHCADLLGRWAKVPLEVVPYVVPARSSYNDNASCHALRAEIGIPPGQRVILCCIDGTAHRDFRNPSDLIAAFETSGLAREGWSLVLKAGKPCNLTADGQALLEAVMRTSGVLLIDRRFDPAKTDVLMSIADICVVPGCAEASAWTVAEAMAYGKIVVAADGGDSRDFLDATCGYPVPADGDTAAWAGALRKAGGRIASGDLSMGRAARERIGLSRSPHAIGELMQRAVAAVLGIR